MGNIRFRTSGGQVIEFTKSHLDVSSKCDYYILCKDRYVFYDKARELLDKNNETLVTKEIADILIKEKLLWKKSQ